MGEPVPASPARRGRRADCGLCPSNLEPVTGDGAQEIETGVGRFELRGNGIIFWKLSFGSTLDEGSAMEAAEAAKALAFGGPVVIIADARELGFADRRAREVLGDAEIEGRVATGVIVSSRVVRYLAEQYARQTAGRRPFEIFNHEGPAIEWANEQLERARQDRGFPAG